MSSPMDSAIMLRLFAGMEERVTRLEERERTYDARLRSVEERERQVRTWVLEAEARSRPPPAHVEGQAPPQAPARTAPAAPPPHRAPAPIDDERARIVAALEKARWNKRKAADALGMPRRTLYRRLHEYELLTDDRNPRPSSS